MRASCVQRSPAEVALSHRSLAERVERQATRHPECSVSCHSGMFACHAISGLIHGPCCGPALPNAGNRTTKREQDGTFDNELAADLARYFGRRFAEDQ